MSFWKGVGLGMQMDRFLKRYGKLMERFIYVQCGDGEK
jgi:hypothetical protein